MIMTDKQAAAYREALSRAHRRYRHTLPGGKAGEWWSKNICKKD